MLNQDTIAQLNQMKNISDAKACVSYAIDNFGSFIKFEAQIKGFSCPDNNELEHLKRITWHSRCRQCGEKFDLNIISNTEYKIIQRCKAHDLIWDFKIDVPSGKLIIANDLRSAFPKDLKDGSVAESAGMHEYTRKYAEAGLFHPYVGRGMNVFKDGNTIHFAAIDEDELYNEETNQVDYHLFRLGKPLGFVCADLWWMSCCDYNELLKIAASNFSLGEITDYLMDQDYFILDVEPGTYLCSATYSSHFEPDVTFDEYSTSFATLTLIP